MAGPLDLQTLCQELLDACIDGLNTIPLYDANLDGAPDRTFISPGRPALEGCDQLCVHVDSLLDADTSGGLRAGTRNRDMKINWAVLVATVDRCVPDPRKSAEAILRDPFPAWALTAVAAQTNADGWALWNHLFNAWRSGSLFTLCTECFFDGARALPEEGGRAGWTLTFRVRLDGYEEIPAS